VDPDATEFSAPALAAKVAAEAARDAALVSGQVYASKAAGIAAAADGASFAVAASGTDAVVVYRRSGATAAEIVRFPTLQGVSDFRYVTSKAQGSDTDLMLFADANGRVFFRMDSAGSLTIPGLSRSVQASLASGLMLAEAPGSTDDLCVWCDDAGNVVARLRANGDMELAGSIVANNSAVETIILDSDMDYDLDQADLGALAALAVQGVCEVAGVITCSSNPTSAPCSRAILDYYGLTGAMVGAYKGSDLTNGYALTGNPAKAVRDQFRPSDTWDNYPSSLDAYRAMLMAAQQPVVIVSTGLAATLLDLLQSPATGIYPSGLELIRQKVKRLVINSGLWPNSASSPAGPNNPEWNLVMDPTRWATLAAAWPTRVEWVGIDLGDPLGVAPPTSDLVTVNPVRCAYHAYLGNATRPAWGATGVLLGAFGPKTFLGLSTTRGQGSVASPSGANSWSPSATGSQFYATKIMSDPDLITYINALLATTP
jgi:hypothetical protein